MGGVIVAPEARAIAEAIRRLDADRAGLAAIGLDAEAAVRTDLSFSTIGASLARAYEVALGTRA